ncbi:hypothetical protein [Lonepinella sp. BR2357]|uniref:hypothetical protein n=1 Tax=Lonepinella sp. BR2357 TaxID=3434549 RepID=UPI003F6DC587
MATTKVVTELDIGKGLEIADAKVQAKVDGKTVIIGEDGALKAVFDVPVDIHLKNATLAGTTVTFEMENGESKTLDLANLIQVAQGENLLKQGDTGLSVSADDVITAIKGEELQSLGGKTIGYLLKTE